MSIKPEDFSSDHPPVRTIGTECEYNHQVTAGSGITNDDFLDGKKLRVGGVNIQNHYLGKEHGSGKAYPDVGLIEFDTRDAMGPASAAKEDIDGIAHTSNIVAATGVPYKGIYRLSGTYIENGLVESGARVSSGRSSGYHESYLFPRYLEKSEAFIHLMPSALAYQIWSRGGTLRQEGFVFSQKIWGCGGEPIEHSLMRRTSHGQKPMITVPTAGNDADTLGASDWARAEIRMPDPGLSLVNRFLSFANVSLTLRLVEQRGRLGISQEQLAALCLAYPVEAAKEYAKDLSLRQTEPSVSGRSLTALDGQEGLLDLFENLLAAEVALPEDELIAIRGIRTVVDALRASNPAEAEYPGAALMRVEFAAKHRFVSKDRSQAAVNSTSRVAMHRNIEWSRILPVGPGRSYWEMAETRDPLAAKVRELATAAGVSKRSALRASIVYNPRGKSEVLNWSYYYDRSGVYRSLGSPAGD